MKTLLILVFFWASAMLSYGQEQVFDMDTDGNITIKRKYVETYRLRSIRILLLTFECWMKANIHPMEADTT